MTSCTVFFTVSQEVLLQLSSLFCYNSSVGLTFAECDACGAQQRSRLPGNPGYLPFSSQTLLTTPTSVWCVTLSRPLALADGSKTPRALAVGDLASSPSASFRSFRNSRQSTALCPGRRQYLGGVARPVKVRHPNGTFR